MAEYFFRRGTFFRWNTPMWAGETQAFKLIRLLRRQGIVGILYEEGPLVKYERTIQHHRPDLVADNMWATNPVREVGEAPSWFKVTF